MGTHMANDQHSADSGRQLLAALEQADDELLMRQTHSDTPLQEDDRVALEALIDMSDKLNDLEALRPPDTLPKLIEPTGDPIDDLTALLEGPQRAYETNRHFAVDLEAHCAAFLARTTVDQARSS